MRYTIATYINSGPGRFDAYETGDLLTNGPIVRLAADTEHAALDRVWTIGNRMDPETYEWPDFIRSLSVGDVLAVKPEGTFPVPVHYFAVASFGFDAITPAQFDESRSGQARISDRGV